jgi:hypothetical protein
MNNPDPVSENLETIVLGYNTLSSLMRIRDPGWKNSGPGSRMEKIRIREKHPGSATLGRTISLSLPVSVGSDSGEEFSGSEGEQAAKKKEKAARKAERIERKKTSKPSGEKTTKKKKKTKLPGQPKKPMSAYFMWLNAEGRDRVKV